MQPLTPPALDRVVRTCLAKDPDDRWQSARDLSRELTWVASGSSEGAEARSVIAPARSNRIAWLVTAVSIIALIATTGIALRRVGEVAPAAGPAQFTIAPPENTSFGGPPPGGGTGVATQVAMSTRWRHRVRRRHPTAYQIWLRPIATLAARPIPGTKGGTFPFWSPDSQFIGFFAAGKLNKVQIAGGPPIVLCDASVGLGGSWSRDNVILFAPGGAAGASLQRCQAPAGCRPSPRPQSGDREQRNAAPVAALSSRWPSLYLHRNLGTGRPWVEAVDDQNWLARPGRRRHHASAGRFVSVVHLRPSVVRPRRDPDGATVRS